MALTQSQRPTREWQLFLLAVLLVGLAVAPFWEAASASVNADFFGRLSSPERLLRLLVGPEQIACYCATLWAGFIIFSRYAELWRQRRAFGLDYLPTDEGARILPEDARPLIRKLDQTAARRGPSVLATMVRMSLGKFAVSRSATDVSEIVRTQSDLEQGRLVTTMATVQYLAWAVPALGFLGTVRGLAGSMTMAAVEEESTSQFLDQATKHLTVAFDCTLIALALSVILMYFLHAIQRDEEALVLDCQQYCQEHLVLRLYDPRPEDAAGV